MWNILFVANGFISCIQANREYDRSKSNFLHWMNPILFRRRRKNKQTIKLCGLVFVHFLLLFFLAAAAAASKSIGAGLTNGISS